MKRLFCLIFCALLLLAFSGAQGIAAQAQTKTTTTQAAAKAKKARRAAAPVAKVQEQPKLTREELASPYSPTGAQNNATRWLMDPAPTGRPFAPAEPDTGLNLRLGREKLIDPLTGKELTPKADAAGAKESLEKLDLKDALNKMGGKAEVQVEILKF